MNDQNKKTTIVAQVLEAKRLLVQEISRPRLEI